MKLLARALQQGLVGSLLDEGMLEQVGRLRWDAALVRREARLERVKRLKASLGG